MQAMSQLKPMIEPNESDPARDNEFIPLFVRRADVAAARRMLSLLASAEAGATDAKTARKVQDQTRARAQQARLVFTIRQRRMQLLGSRLSAEAPFDSP